MKKGHAAEIWRVSSFRQLSEMDGVYFFQHCFYLSAGDRTKMIVVEINDAFVPLDLRDVVEIDDKRAVHLVEPVIQLFDLFQSRIEIDQPRFADQPYLVRDLGSFKIKNVRKGDLEAGVLIPKDKQFFTPLGGIHRLQV